MKGLILSGGKGTRLYPITFNRAKQLVPVANKPVLFRVIEAIKEAGIDDIGIVIGDTGPEIREAVGQGRRWGVRITYIQQEAPLGLAHAVKISQDFLGDERFVMFLGDNVIQGGISSLIREFASSNWNSQIVLTEVDQPQHYGVAELDERGAIVRLIEKPRNPPSNLALVGIYMFDHNIFTAVNNIKPSWRGELEITDAIQWLIEHGFSVHPYIHRGWWIDTGKPIDMLEANNRVLAELEHKVEGYVDRDSKIDHLVTVERGAEIINSVIRGPAIIGEDTRIVNSYIGPFTSIYHHTVIENSEIEHSIVLDHSRIINVPSRIEDSIIGRDVEITYSPIKPKAYKMTLGDHSKVGLL
ncbi:MULTISPECIES: glucose-1-phosphate thymidylyltransferase [Caldilinea]|jgi:glucose-1-phosphate thymidylyltransferase|uniref:Glucose-1-phosphate thymidylyltransferase n=1 Tax=Caldilinea aerophila (strain DSM 14535 / JCM 11387 / NBRC 104270 / STL-6-O1) TaxID=926550 RepID=I0HYS7_CALAS|nr:MULTISPECIES: glucose-1-phosphate thymidylyltransferase [Caldilinea]MBO9391852.1 glucose-1-phosphate thymidylyltransferase [Caldilinea sp.]PMB18068.1 glucose-1-phosphate thymidylyltransferase [Fischerella thermalis CCMEE 5319]BAL98164.1 glucose-1-phosphate thymidylyltransferase [Caldilinea aerophila DSM 14535 = NBRC 104270]GIV75481.1 MAG: glucose-1-phosphate thymidylyltransferase [Caldilinea sp.]